MADLINCRRCGKIRAVDDDLRCATCGELVCLVCGCTESAACIGDDRITCGWARPGICTECVLKILTGD